MGPIGYSPLAFGDLDDLAINDLTGKVLDTSAKTVTLMASGGRGMLTYSVNSSDPARVNAAVEGNVLTVSFVHDVNFPYSDYTVTVSATDGVGTMDESFKVRRNRAPMKGSAYDTARNANANNDDRHLITVGTQHPSDSKTTKMARLGTATADSNTLANLFKDDDTLTFSGVAMISAEGSHIMLESVAGAIKVMGVKSTGVVDADAEATARVGKAVAVNVTATDTGDLKLTKTDVFHVEVDEAPKLSGGSKATLRDITIRLSETASAPIRLVRIGEHFMDPEGRPLKYGSVSSDNTVGTVEDVSVQADADGAPGALEVAPATGAADDASPGIKINPLKAGTATITVTATEDDQDGQENNAIQGFQQTVAATFTVTVLAQ
jgi:hypothetical protein